jgi:tetratricopeptide (TPR) repeat protein
VQAPTSDIFQLQDELTRQIVEAMAIPLTPGERGAMRRDVPANPIAYEHYLRANQLAHSNRHLADARDLYVTCLEEDPNFAPGWARLGRVYRLMAKYGHGDSDDNFKLAEEAFRKALDINPDLTMAHNLYTYLELEELGRSRESLVRLLERVGQGRQDPQLYSALVVACRFAGLLEASVAADAHARRLDPAVRTSVANTYWMLGDYERAMRADDEEMRFVYNYSLPYLGRTQEAIARYRDLEASRLPGIERAISTCARAAIEGNRMECAAAAREILASRFHDPEGLLHAARPLSLVGETDFSLEVLQGVVESGLYCPRVLTNDPWLDPIRTDPRFTRILQRAVEGQRAAAADYLRVGGESILGAPAR